MDKELKIFDEALTSALDLAYNNQEDKDVAMGIIAEFTQIFDSEYLIAGVIGGIAILKPNRLPVKDKRFIEVLRIIANMFEIAHDVRDRENKK